MAKGDKQLQTKAESFIEIYKSEWKIEISHHALETLEVKKYNKPLRLPFAGDLKALTLFLKKRQRKQ